MIFLRNFLDYVIRRFNASSAELKMPEGAELSLDRRLTRSPGQLELRAEQASALLGKFSQISALGSAQNWIAITIQTDIGAYDLRTAPESDGSESGDSSGDCVRTRDERFGGLNRGITRGCAGFHILANRVSFAIRC